MSQVSPPSDFVPVADVEVSAVHPERSGFVMEGRGADRADYRIQLDLEVPVDQRTRAVLGELLSQSKWRVWRRAPQPLKGITRAPRREGKPTAS